MEKIPSSYIHKIQTSHFLQSFTSVPTENKQQTRTHTHTNQHSLKPGFAVAEVGEKRQI